MTSPLIHLKVNVNVEGTARDPKIAGEAQAQTQLGPPVVASATTLFTLLSTG